MSDANRKNFETTAGGALERASSTGTPPPAARPAPHEDHHRGRGAGTAAAVAFVTVAGLAALAFMTNRRPPREGREAPDAWHDLEVERSLTIAGDKAGDLARQFSDPKTLAKVAARHVTIEPEGSDRTRWTGPAVLGTWTMKRTETGEVTRWEAEHEEAPLQEMSVRFRPATAGRGTVATLHLRANPPGGWIGRAATHAMGDFLPAAFATGVLYAFKALVETGEVPTTEHQPAARRDTR